VLLLLFSESYSLMISCRTNWGNKVRHKLGGLLMVPAVVFISF